MKTKIDRKSAARLLNVSIRTVDRYVAQNKVKSEKIDGRIWLDKKEILSIKNKDKVDTDSRQNLEKKDEMSIDNPVSTSVDMSTGGVDLVSTAEYSNTSKERQNQGWEVYKKLYEELSEELKIKQNRLEGANYRVGQLEAMVKESVPLIDHQKLLGSEKAARFELEEETESLREKLERMAKILKEEKVSKKVYFVILFIIMLLQPFWIIFLMK